MLGIYGGTFDPVHHGHLRAALEVKQLLQLEAVRFVLSAVPPHRGAPCVDGEKRFQLLQLALEASEGFTADRRELDREGPSYMIDTLQSFRQDFPDTPISLILGMDAFLGLPGWHRWRDLFKFAHVVVTNRADVAPQMDEILRNEITPLRCSEPAQLRQSTHGLVYSCRISNLEVSASRIRADLARGLSTQYLVPEAVRREIQAQGLYVS